MKPLGFAANKKEMREDPDFYKGTIGDASEMIRLVLAGRKNSPNLYYVEQILGKDRIINRFKKVE